MRFAFVIKVPLVPFQYWCFCQKCVYQGKTLQNEDAEMHIDLFITEVSSFHLKAASRGAKQQRPRGSQRRCDLGAAAF